jgi:hypothetical protein
LVQSLLQIAGRRALCAVACGAGVDEYTAVGADGLAFGGRARWIRPAALAALPALASTTSVTAYAALPGVALSASSPIPATRTAAFGRADKAFGAAVVAATEHG